MVQNATKVSPGDQFLRPCRDHLLVRTHRRKPNDKACLGNPLSSSLVLDFPNPTILFSIPPWGSLPLGGRVSLGRPPPPWGPPPRGGGPLRGGGRHIVSGYLVFDRFPAGRWPRGPVPNGVRGSNDGAQAASKKLSPRRPTFKGRVGTLCLVRASFKIGNKSIILYFWLLAGFRPNWAPETPSSGPGSENGAERNQSWPRRPIFEAVS